jgi:hypothetical protein
MVSIKKGAGMTGGFRALFVLILMVTMGEASLQASGHPDLSGLWTLDLKAPESISMEALLGAQGVSMIMRRTMDTMSMTLDITQTDKTLTIKFNPAFFGEQTVTLILDGRTHVLDIEKLGKIEFRSVWDKNGTCLVTTMKSKAPDSRKPVWTSRRYLKDEGITLIVDHFLTVDDGRKLTGRRVFRKP